MLALIPIGPPVEAIEAGLLTEFTVGFAVVSLFAILTAVLRLLRGR
jgi:uncharacterized membrane protein YozB (DUF420 family)